MGDEDDVHVSIIVTSVRDDVGLLRGGGCRRRPDLPWCSDVYCVRSQED